MGWKVETAVMMKIIRWWLLALGEQAPVPQADLKWFSAKAAPWMRALHRQVPEPAEPEPHGKRKQ